MVDWVKESEAEGPQQAERMPDGVHIAKIVKCLLGSKNGPFTTRTGSPQVMLVFENEAGQEATTMLALSLKATWRVAQLCSRVQPSCDLERMKADGVMPGDFADQEFCDAQFLGKKIRISVEGVTNDEGKTWTNVEFEKWADDPHERPAVASSSSNTVADISEEDIPF